MRIAFGGGGTGGHVVPALAVALELKNMGYENHFIGNNSSIEEKLSTDHGFEFHAINVRKLYREGVLRNALFPYYLFNSIISSIRILNMLKPKAVFCTGGFVSAPLAIAAILLRIPLFGHESNSYPGLVTRSLSRFYTRIFISFDASRKFIKNSNVSNHGIPILTTKNSSFTIEATGLDRHKPILLISGGSQGSVAINQVIDSALEQIINMGYQVIWQTGRNSYSRFFTKYGSQSGLYLFDFSPELPFMLDYVDLAITRAGALTIAELENKHIPVILIPLPTAAENHQYHNALAQQDKGVALVLEQSRLNAETLISYIKTLYENREIYRSAFNKLPTNNAASDIAREISETLKIH